MSGTRTDNFNDDPQRTGAGGSRRDEVLSELPDFLVSFLEGGQPTVVATVEEDGGPATTLMSWLVAVDPKRVRLCVDTRSRAFHNIVERRQVALEILGDGITWGVRGEGVVLREQMESTPFPCGVVEVRVADVRDHSAPGTLFKGPSYSYTDDKQHRLEFERQVYEELRSIQG